MASSTVFNHNKELRVSLQHFNLQLYCVNHAVIQQEVGMKVKPKYFCMFVHVMSIEWKIKGTNSSVSVSQNLNELSV